jgi:hypothetical protein
MYIWLEVAPAASSALATTSQLRTSVDIAVELKMYIGRVLLVRGDSETRPTAEHTKLKTPSNGRARESFFTKV